MLPACIAAVDANSTCNRSEPVNIVTVDFPTFPAMLSAAKISMFLVCAFVSLIASPTDAMAFP
jgi:hypothetical protein